MINKKLLVIIFLSMGILLAKASDSREKDDEDGGITTRNLRVIPRNIPHEELINIMRGINLALGVKCGYCHVEIPGKVTAEGHPAYNFASDDKEHKRVARKMMRMVKDINERVADMGNGKFTDRVGCVTCHRGNTQPSVSLDTALRQAR